MNLANKQPVLRQFATANYGDWRTAASLLPKKDRLFIVASGYETRSIYWLSRILESLPLSDRVSCLVLGFEDFSTALARPKNDEFYKAQGLKPQAVSSTRRQEFEEFVKREVGSIVVRSGDQPVEVHVDYSCMPRLWYCRLPGLLEELLRPQDYAYLWYTPGVYPEADYPTAGVEDFQVFSGRPSLGASLRTHIFGLGFDRIRSQAIWSIIDPQQLVCFYADPAGKQEYVQRVESDNKAVLSIARHVFTVPIHDFAFAYSRITAVASEFGDQGDVILVPDGPKPLILAASLVPLRLGRQGITCFHVKRRKTEDFTPVDVQPLGDPVGFCFAGRSDV